MAAITVFSYNTRNQTGTITPPGGGTATAMSYAGGTQDERLTRGPTSFVTGPMGMATETTATSATRYRYDDTGTLLARQGPGGSSDTQYYLRDGLGSIVALTDTAGNVAASYTYDPYGITTASGTTLATTNPWRYAAGYTDTTTGLTKFGTRYYNPNLGRWTQPDHWGPENGYTYANNNPVNRTDPTGRWPWEDDDFGLGDILQGAGVVLGVAGAFATGGASLALTAASIGASSIGSGLEYGPAEGAAQAGLGLATAGLGGGFASAFGDEAFSMGAAGTNLGFQAFTLMAGYVGGF